jgi:hypothetical protein
MLPHTPPVCRVSWLPWSFLSAWVYYRKAVLQSRDVCEGMQEGFVGHCNRNGILDSVGGCMRTPTPLSTNRTLNGRILLVILFPRDTATVTALDFQATAGTAQEHATAASALGVPRGFSCASAGERECTNFY